MTTREYLESYQYLKMQIIHSEKQLEDVAKEIASLQAIDYSKEKIQAPAQNDPIGNLVIEVVREKTVLCMKILGYKTKKNLIESQVDKIKDIDPKAYILLYQLFIACIPSREIKVGRVTTDRQFYRDLSKAMKIFEKLFGITYKNA
jgi:hypothetical protein